MQNHPEVRGLFARQMYDDLLAVFVTCVLATVPQENDGIETTSVHSFERIRNSHHRVLVDLLDGGIKNTLAKFRRREVGLDLKTLQKRADCNDKTSAVLVLRKHLKNANGIERLQTANGGDLVRRVLTRQTRNQFGDVTPETDVDTIMVRIVHNALHPTHSHDDVLSAGNCGRKLNVNRRVVEAAFKSLAHDCTNAARWHTDFDQILSRQTVEALVRNGLISCLRNGRHNQSLVIDRKLVVCVDQSIVLKDDVAWRFECIPLNNF